MSGRMVEPADPVAVLKSTRRRKWFNVQRIGETTTMTVSRTAYVPAERMAGWAERFQSGHGPAVLTETDDGVLLAAADGATALMQPPWPVDGRPGHGTDPIERLASLAAQHRTVAVVLLRRGGYSLGLCRGGRVLESKSGTKYVQSRTAAGGWSQQRYARRRANQADALVESVAAHALRIFAGTATNRADYLVLGGDKALCQALLTEPGMAALAGLAQLTFRDVPDPRLTVLQQVAKDLFAVRILVTDPVT